MEEGAIFLPNQVGTVHYLPDYVSHEEERRLINHVDQRTKQWKQMGSGRRLQMYGGDPGDGKQPMIPVTMPAFLAELNKRIFDGGLMKKLANHVLVNEYPPGTGIEAHQDGPLYNESFVILSLGSGILLNLYPHRSLSPELGDPVSPFASLYLRPRSLLIVEGDVYTKCLHGISSVQSDTIRPDCANAEVAKVAAGESIERELRYSFTIRTVNRIVKNKFFKF